MNWYYVDRGQQAGPVSDEQLDGMLQSGKIQPDTLVWREGMAAWLPYREARGGAASTGTTVAAAAPTPEAVCAECGKLFPIDETIRYGNARVCAGCKPVFLQKLQEGAAINTGEMRYAGFGIRFAATFLDGLILGVPMIIVFIAIGATSASNAESTASQIIPLFIQMAFIFVQIAYQVFFWGKFGATPGKMACKIKVVSSDGSKISYGRATGRAFAEMLSGMVCYIGYLLVAFDNPQRRALHDHICNTRVIFK
jgi:uncharacterized RDD family membrane protein YckC